MVTDLGVNAGTYWAHFGGVDPHQYSGAGSDSGNAGVVEAQFAGVVKSSNVNSSYGQSFRRRTLLQVVHMFRMPH